MKLSIISLILVAFVAFTSCESEKVNPEVILGDTAIALDDDPSVGDLERSSSCYGFVGRVTRPLTFPVTITFNGGRTTQVVRTAADLTAIDRLCNQNIRPTRIRVTRSPHTRGSLTRGRGR